MLNNMKEIKFWIDRSLCSEYEPEPNTNECPLPRTDKWHSRLECHKVRSTYYRWKISFYSLSELLQFMEDEKENIILYRPGDYDESCCTLTIYDGYVE